MHNKVETGILLLFPLVILEFVIAVPLDGPKTIDRHGSDDESQDSSHKKIREADTFVNRLEKQNNEEDLTPMETRFFHGSLPNSHPPQSGFVKWNPAGGYPRSFEEHHASNTDHYEKDNKGKRHWSFEKDYFKDRHPYNRGNHPHHKYPHDNGHTFHHSHGSDPKIHNHEECRFRSESTLGPTTTRQSTSTSTTPATTNSPSIDIRISDD